MPSFSSVFQFPKNLCRVAMSDEEDAEEDAMDWRPAKVGGLREDSLKGKPLQGRKKAALPTGQLKVTGFFSPPPKKARSDGVEGVEMTTFSSSTTSTTIAATSSSPPRLSYGGFSGD